MTVFVPYVSITGETERVGVEMNGRRRWIIPPRYKQIGRQCWVLLADAIYCSGPCIMRYRKGYQWDGASVPKLLQWYEMAGDHLPASLRHDSAYQFHFVEAWDIYANEWVRAKVGKAWADAEFRADLDAANVRDTKEFTLWWHVHVYGWWPWLTGTCNGRHSPTACPADAWSWCPYRYGLPPIGDIDVTKPQAED
jgi:hypothetical protein